MSLEQQTRIEDQEGKRAREGSKQCTCQLECDREQATQRRQQQGPEARAAEMLRVQARRARKGGSKQCACKLEGNREHGNRAKTTGGYNQSIGKVKNAKRTAREGNEQWSYWLGPRASKMKQIA